MAIAASQHAPYDLEASNGFHCPKGNTLDTAERACRPSEGNAELIGVTHQRDRREQNFNASFS